MGRRKTVLTDCELIRQTLCDTTGIEAELQRMQDEMAVAAELMLSNAQIPVTHTKYPTLCLAMMSADLLRAG